MAYIVLTILLPSVGLTNCELLENLVGWLTGQEAPLHPPLHLLNLCDILRGSSVALTPPGSGAGAHAACGTSALVPLFLWLLPLPSMCPSDSPRLKISSNLPVPCGMYWQPWAISTLPNALWSWHPQQRVDHLFFSMLRFSARCRTQCNKPFSF